MKNAKLLGALVVTAIALAACGTPAAPAATTVPAAPAATTVPDATIAPDSTTAPDATTAPDSTTAPDATNAPDATIVATVVSATTATTATSLPDLGGREVTIAIENAYIPFNYVRLDNGQAEGWDYDTLAEVCKRLNCKPVFKELAWDGMIAAVASKQFDMAADGISITEERAKTVDFSEGYIQVDQKLLVRGDETRFNTVADFQKGDYKVATQKGTTNFDTAVKLVGESRILALDDFGAVVQAVLAKDADAATIDDVAGQGYIGANADKLKLIDEVLEGGGPLGFIYAKGSDLVAPINAALQAMKADGSLQKINDKWFPKGKAVITYDEIGPGAYGTTTTETVTTTTTITATETITATP